MLAGIQLIALLFCLLASYFSFINLKRHEFTIREFLGWEVIWLAFGFATLFPAEFQIFSNKFGAMRPLDLFTILGFVVTLSIAFYTYTQVDRIRKKLESTIRDLALKDIKKKI